MNRKQSRRVTIRLDEIEDADLIHWLEMQPRRGRSAAIRGLMRTSLEAERRKPVIDINAIRHAVAEEIRQALKGVALQVAGGEIDTESSQVEQQYGSKLDRMLGGLGSR